MCHGGDDERELRRRALAALHADLLPRVRPVRSWGGDGSGELCPVCGHSIEPAEKELELEFATADGEDTVREFHLHLPCFAAWSSQGNLRRRKARTISELPEIRHGPPSSGQKRLPPAPLTHSAAAAARPLHCANERLCRRARL